MSNSPLPESIEPTRVLKDGCAEEYVAGMSDFFSELAELNANIETIERLLPFPADLFGVGSNTGGVFLPLTLKNTAGASILKVTRLTTDSIDTARTLPKFKGRIERELIRDEYRQAFGRRMRERRFDADTRALLDKAKQLRDTYLAHFTADRNAASLTLAELKTLRDGLNTLFQALSFNAQYQMLPVEYDQLSTDLDRILASIAKDSPIVHLHETQPELWQARRKQLSADELDIVNRYRKALSLPTA